MSSPPTKEELELLQLQHEVEKLQLEVAALKRWGWLDIGSRLFGSATLLVAIATAWIGFSKYQSEQALAEERFRAEQDKLATDRANAAEMFRTQQQQRLDDAQKAEKVRADELKRDSAKPFWEAQFKLYLRASEAAALVATSDNEETRFKAEREFWVLYYGPLAMVEDISSATRPPAVTKSMVAFGRYLEENKDVPKRDRARMQQLSLNLAHAMRDAAGWSFDLSPANIEGTRSGSGGLFSGLHQRLTAPRPGGADKP